MYCTKCGTKLEDGMRFCDNCGVKIENRFSAPPVSLDEAEKTESSYKTVADEAEKTESSYKTVADEPEKTEPSCDTVAAPPVLETEQEEVLPEANENELSVNEEPSPKKKKHVKKWVIIVCIIAALLVVAAAVGAVFIIKAEKEIIDQGEAFTVAGVVSYNLEEGSAAVTCNEEYKFRYEDAGKKVKLTENVILASGDDAALLRHYVDKTVTVTGVFSAEKGGVIIKNAEILSSEGEHNHSFSMWTPTADGALHENECICGEHNVEDHGFDNGTVTIEATHTTEGELVYECVDCGITKTEVIEKLTEHEFGTWEKLDDDKHIKTCPCGESEEQAHEWVEDETQSTNTKKVYTCICLAVKEEEIANLEDRPASDGLYHYYCYYSEYVTPDGEHFLVGRASKNSIHKRVEELGATLIADIEYYEETSKEYRGKKYRSEELGLIVYIK
ncbi:MAG: zinc ribbon domain-containing protein [Christensenellaceae bacterium]|nr:zinc ribbon domain-containing protein [Christensenellaceae bacterium]